MATHSSTLAWKILWMEEPGRLQSMGSLGVGHDWATSLSLFTFVHWRRKWQPTPVFFPGESQRQRSLVGCCIGVAQSQTQLKWLSSSSSRAIKDLKSHLLRCPLTPPEAGTHHMSAPYGATCFSGSSEEVELWSQRKQMCPRVRYILIMLSTLSS